MNDSVMRCGRCTPAEQYTCGWPGSAYGRVKSSFSILPQKPRGYSRKRAGGRNKTGGSTALMEVVKKYGCGVRWASGNMHARLDFEGRYEATLYGSRHNVM